MVSSHLHSFLLTHLVATNLAHMEEWNGFAQDAKSKAGQPWAALT